jgi:hypothetical protein
MLRFLRNQADLPWLCVGDFNEILHTKEQMGGNDREEWYMDGFRDTVSYCGFTDMRYKGLPYTWDNRREGAHNVKVRLDRGLADDAWLQLFGLSTVTHVQMAESDHCALYVHVARAGGSHGAGGKLFHYENMWQRHHRYNDVVEGAWIGRCDNLQEVHNSLGHMQSTMARWNKEEFGSVRGELQRLRKQLEVVRGCTIRNGPATEERRIMLRLAELLAREETMEKQHSRVQWLHEGSRNTGFFQAKARQWARTNIISALYRNDGSLCEVKEELEAMEVGFYHDLFTAQEHTEPELVA